MFRFRDNLLEKSEKLDDRLKVEALLAAYFLSHPLVVGVWGFTIVLALMVYFDLL